LLLWRFIDDGNSGLLNNLLGAISFGAFPKIDWLGNPSSALGAIIAMSIWQVVGFHLVIWLAGLQTISPTLYEAGALEGASKWQIFRNITWPGLRNIAVLVLIVIIFPLVFMLMSFLKSDQQLPQDTVSLQAKSSRCL
jgi:multiple sugar transport system permease protein